MFLKIPTFLGTQLWALTIQIGEASWPGARLCCDSRGAWRRCKGLRLVEDLMASELPFLRKRTRFHEVTARQSLFFPRCLLRRPGLCPLTGLGRHQRRLHLRQTRFQLQNWFWPSRKSCSSGFGALFADDTWTRQAYRDDPDFELLHRPVLCTAWQIVGIEGQSQTFGRGSISCWPGPSIRPSCRRALGQLEVK